MIALSYSSNFTDIFILLDGKVHRVRPIDDVLDGERRVHLGANSSNLSNKLIIHCYFIILHSHLDWLLDVVHRRQRGELVEDGFRVVADANVIGGEALLQAGIPVIYRTKNCPSYFAGIF